MGGGSFQFTSPGFLFKASAGWAKNLKNKYIRQRHVTKYISNKDSMTFEETVKAELFQKQTVTVIPNHSLNYVINADQMGCEYCVSIRLTLSHRGEKHYRIYNTSHKQNYAFLHCAVCYYGIG
jgi:hypothetical protein